MKTHGKSRTPEHVTWCKIIQRCYNPKTKEFARYGGKGITLCQRWQLFENFLADMGPKPSPKHSIDRYPDQAGNYEPGNCRWATVEEQANNKASNCRLILDGEVRTVPQWARRCGLKVATVRARIFVRNWTVRKTLTTPLEIRGGELRRDRLFVTLSGQTKRVSEWAEENRIHITTIFDRLQRGWRLEDAVSRPTGPQGPKIISSWETAQ